MSVAKTIEGLIDTEGESAQLLVQAGWRSAEARLVWYTFQAVVPLLLVPAVLAYGALALTMCATMLPLGTRAARRLSPRAFQRVEEIDTPDQ